MSQISEIEKIVKESIENSKDFTWKEFHWKHIISVRKYAVELATRMEKDIDLCEVSALLHDIGKFIYGPENCEISSAEESKKILDELGFEKEFIEKVKQTILVNGKFSYLSTEIEEKILACADVMSHFDVIAEQFYLMLKEGIEFKDAKSKIRSKLNEIWNQIESIPKAQEILKREYEAAKLILRKD